MLATHMHTPCTHTVKKWTDAHTQSARVDTCTHRIVHECTHTSTCAHTYIATSNGSVSRTEVHWRSSGGKHALIMMWQFWQFTNPWSCCFILYIGFSKAFLVPNLKKIAIKQIQLVLPEFVVLYLR